MTPTYFYIVYQDYEIPTLDTSRFVLSGLQTIRYSVDKKQAILRIQPESLPDFNLSRALTESEALSLVAGLAWAPPNPTTSNAVSQETPA